MRKFIALAAVGAATVLSVVAIGSGSAQAQSLTCNNSYFKTTFSSVTVPSGGNCILDNVTVTGGVTVSNNSFLEVCDTRIGGSLSATGAYLKMDNSSSIGGSLTINKPGTSELVGDRDLCETFEAAPGVQPNSLPEYSTFICPWRIGGSVTVSNAPHSLNEVSIGDCGSGFIGGPVLISNNRAPVELVDQFVYGNVTCVNNNPTADAEDVTAHSIHGCLTGI